MISPLVGRPAAINLSPSVRTAILRAFGALHAQLCSDPCKLFLVIVRHTIQLRYNLLYFLHTVHVSRLRPLDIELAQLVLEPFIVLRSVDRHTLDFRPLFQEILKIFLSLLLVCVYNHQLRLFYHVLELLQAFGAVRHDLVELKPEGVGRFLVEERAFQFGVFGFLLAHGDGAELALNLDHVFELVSTDQLFVTIVLVVGKLRNLA